MIASADDTTDTVVLTARLAGAAGEALPIRLLNRPMRLNRLADGSQSEHLSARIRPPLLPVLSLTCSARIFAPTPPARRLLAGPSAVLHGWMSTVIDGNPVPLLYVSPTQVNAQMPWEYADRSSVSVYLRVTTTGWIYSVTAPVAVTIAGSQPGYIRAIWHRPAPRHHLPCLQQCDRSDYSRWHH